MMDNIEMKYSVGALLYSPALNRKVADSVIGEKFDRPYSLALCLEDTISDDSIEMAEEQLSITLKTISDATKEKDFYLPKIFIRVRSSEQLLRIFKNNKDNFKIVKGFIFPKYSLGNADAYNKAVEEINNKSSQTFYMMPILESKDIVDYSTRRDVLVGIKAKIDSVKDYVLNVRVGGNDFSNEFAARRHYDETIYDILPIAQLLGDILTVFSRDYVVSGPVWEYFGAGEGLKKELELDRLNGFIGKTAIHPTQLPLIYESMQVEQSDYDDAMRILNWNLSSGVAKSENGKRMNEVKVHGKWAEKIVMLKNIYGIRSEKEGESHDYGY